MHTAETYAAWIARYMHEYDAPREVFGRIAINNRAGASKNPNAMMRTPITMDDAPWNARPMRRSGCSTWTFRWTAAR